MTNFIDKTKIKKEGKNTVFKKTLVANMKVSTSSSEPSSFQNVELILRDRDYGDVFLAWDFDESDKAIYFGIAGDEF